MKFKTLGALCKKRERFYLYDSVTSDGELTSQWMGDGGAIYPLSGIPCLREESIYTIFDITSKQQEKMFFRHDTLPETINTNDVDTSEYPVDDVSLMLCQNGRTLKVLYTRHGIVFVDEEYLTPLADVADMLELYERQMPSGQTYIVAKTGFLLAGIIFPLNLIRKEFVQQLEYIAQQCRTALENKNIYDNKDKSAVDSQEEQTSIQ